jgi:hypothetical protein
MSHENAKPDCPVADDVGAFFRRHREILLRYLDDKAPATPNDPEPLDYVDQVLDEWHELSANRTLAKPASLERTFWFALYQLETVAEFPTNVERHPYELLLIENLVKVRELLRNGKPLPSGYFASRPGE